jgi:hypothetical protein
LAFIFATLFFVSLSAAAQDGSCAGCHIANPEAPDIDHIMDWEHSAHGRSGISCESCHGGDATSFDRFTAHQDVLTSRNPASPVHRANIPRTCGSCHPGPFVAFQRSHHFEMLEEGNPSVPVCTTCHGDVAARLLSPRSLEARCQRCHQGRRGAPERPEFAPLARSMLAGVDEVRALLNQARPLLRRVDDAERRLALEEAWNQANVPLVEAAEAGHAFVFDELESRLAVARERAERLLDDLANPDEG